jgi:hypothetical protein
LLRNDAEQKPFLHFLCALCGLSELCSRKPIALKPVLDKWVNRVAFHIPLWYNGIEQMFQDHRS